MVFKGFEIHSALLYVHLIHRYMNKNIVVMMARSLTDTRRIILHVIHRDCLRDAILYNEDPVLKCPFMEDYACDGIVQDREIKAVSEYDI